MFLPTFSVSAACSVRNFDVNRGAENAYGSKSNPRFRLLREAIKMRSPEVERDVETSILADFSHLNTRPVAAPANRWIGRCGRDPAPTSLSWDPVFIAPC
jgi:hypothetical protein